MERKRIVVQKFSELPYTRPDIAAAVEEYKRYSEAFKAAKTFEEAKKVFLDAEKLDKIGRASCRERV